MDEMSSGYRRIFWGLFFSTFHINLGSIQILPEFIAVLILFSGIARLCGEYPSYLYYRARIFAGVFLAQSIIGTVIPFFMPVSSALMMIDITTGSMLNLLLVYYILAGSVEWLHSIAAEEGNVNRCQHNIAVYIVWSLLVFIGEIIVLVSADQSAVIAVLVVGVIVKIWLMTMVSSLKKVADYYDLNEETENQGDIGKETAPVSEF